MSWTAQPVGWVEPFAKPIILPRVHRVMGIASFHPSYALHF
jgi:hypothetical protein